METLYQLLALAGAGLIIWVIYQHIKGRPELFTRTNLMKSFSSMGVLALLLIAFVALLVMMLR